MNAKASEPLISRNCDFDANLAMSRLAVRYDDVRRVTESLCSPLEIEDYVVQSMPDASPAKWHLAHTSWFFETFILKPAFDGTAAVSDHYGYLFNSYYNALGERIPRAERGLLTRPTVAETYNYRAEIDERMRDLFATADETVARRFAGLIELGLHHEQQHQELILTDLKHAFGFNPLCPVYRDRDPITGASSPGPLRWIGFPVGLRQVGHDGAGFAFDNESPRHSCYSEAFQIADRLVTNAEYLAFIAERGYERPEFWLSDGWNVRTARGWTAPLYWADTVEGWQMMTLSGLRPVDPNEPVCHVSFYEADAFARWSKARLATEAEWEVAAEGTAITGNFLEDACFHPAPLAGSACDGIPAQLFGDVWEWTGSPYTPYPGYQPAAGALGEYNGKFMCNQMVLRGGSCATPRSHIRATYRNFFPPDARWQFSGIRLAKDDRGA